jgi:hypothetical protein
MGTRFGRAMGEAWFTGYADELARCLVDAQNCAEACEAYLSGLDGSTPEDGLRRAVDVLAAPAAVSRILIELIDQPPQLVLAAARLCRELTSTAAEELDGPPEVVEALRAVADSAGDLVDAAG